MQNSNYRGRGGGGKSELHGEGGGGCHPMPHVFNCIWVISLLANRWQQRLVIQKDYKRYNKYYYGYMLLQGQI